MKKLLIIITVFMITSCNLLEPEKTRIIVMNPQDTVVVEDSRKIMVLSEYEFNLFESFTPPIKDIAYYFHTHKDKYKLDQHTFDCGIFEFWISNGHSYFRLYKPTKIELTAKEKHYFWSEYNNYKKNMRLYNWESEYTIEKAE